MKILVVSQYFWPENFRINELVKRLAQRGHDLQVLTGIPNYPKGFFEKGYAWFRPFRQLYASKVPLIRSPLIPRRFSLGINYLSFAFFGSLVGLFACRKRYDAIFVYVLSPITVVFPALVLKWLGRGPVILWVQDLWPESLENTGAIKNPWLLKLAGKMVDFLYRHSDLILGQSEGFVKAISARGVPLSKLRVFPNTAEELYQPTAPTAEIESQLPQGFRVMFAGNMGVAQDLGTLLDAASELRDQKDIHWIVVGDGREREKFLKRAQEMQLKQVHWMGSHPIETMPQWFASANALLVTLRDEPGFALTVPGKVQSYLACAKPVVAALRGDGKAVVERAQCGVVVEPQSPKQLARAVLELKQQNADTLNAMGKRGRNYFDAHFEGSILTETLEQWMRSFEASRPQ